MAANTKVDTIIDGIRARILSGEFGESGRLPSFRKLVNEYETSQETMNKAMQALQAEGLLVSAGAKGVFVNTARIRFPGMVADFYEDFLKKQPNPFEVFIEKPKVIEASSDLAKRINLPKGTPILQRIRKQGTGNTTLRIVDEYFPMKFLNEGLLEKINTDPHFNAILAIKQTLRMTISFTHEELISRLPTVEEQKELQIVRTNPIIFTQITHFANDKKTVITCNNKILNANNFQLIYDYPSRHWDK